MSMLSFGTTYPSAPPPPCSAMATRPAFPVCPTQLAGLPLCRALRLLCGLVSTAWPTTCLAACLVADEDKAGVARKRAVLRLLVELLLVGLCSAHSVLLGIVKQLVAATDFRGDPEGAQAALSLLTALAKAGREELLGMPPALPVALAPESLPSGEAGGSGPEAQAAEAFRAAVGRYEAALARRYSLPPEVQATLRSAVERCFEGACSALTAAHAALQATEAENARVLNSRGDLPEDMAAAYEAQRKGFEGLQRAAAGLAEVLDRPLPELKQAVTRMAAAAEEPGAEAGEQQTQQVQPRGQRILRLCAVWWSAHLVTYNPCSGAIPAEPPS